MRFKKIISVALALVGLLLSLMVFQMFQKTQLVMFDPISLKLGAFSTTMKILNGKVIVVA